MIMLADRLLDGVPGQRVFGGIDMTVRRNAFGRQVDSFEREVTFDGAPFHAVFIRAPWVEQAGPGVTVLGRIAGKIEVPPDIPPQAVSPEDGSRIIGVRQGALLATAFHPELAPDRRVHELFVSIVKGTS
jgi:5'-phosphate synthase pdxT subunit